MKIFSKFVILVFVSFVVVITCIKKENIIDASIYKDNYKDEILEKVKEMSLDEKVGQLFVGGIEGMTLSERDISLIDKYKLSGIIFFGYNIGSSNEVVDLTNQIKDLNKDNIPMFLSIDQEGGIVTRLPKEINKFLSARDLGRINDPNFTYRVNKLMGDIISKLGFNMDFAPVLDVYTNSENTVIGSRAYSSDKDIVSSHGIEAMRGLSYSNVIPVGKHYPGHGDTREDSHYELPIVSHNYDRIMDVELYPFKEAIDEGIDLILVSHLLYEKIDSENIATFSSILLNDILRKELGFKGLVITDDMIMKGLTSISSIEDGCVKALNAGVDLLLIGSQYENIVKSIERVKIAIINGEIDQFLIDKKVYNILKIKQKYNLNNDKLPYVDVNEINISINDLLNKS